MILVDANIQNELIFRIEIFPWVEYPDFFSLDAFFGFLWSFFFLKNPLNRDLSACDNTYISKPQREMLISIFICFIVLKDFKRSTQQIDVQQDMLKSL